MAYPSGRVSPVVRFLFLLFLLLLSPARLWAKGCGESLPGPAQLPPPSLWGDLQPQSILVDATRWTGSELPNNSFPISTSVDIENGWIFQSFYGGFSIWDGRTNPAAPARASITGGHAPTRQFPSWPMLTEFTQVVFAIDVPEGNDNIAAVGAIAPVGLTVWDTTTKTAPLALYQDTARNSHQVYAARIGGRDYAFVADFHSSITQGLFVYDMTAAKGLDSCVENSVSGVTHCPNVYRGRIGDQEHAKYVHGLAVGNRHFIVKSAGNSNTLGIKIYEVTNPLQPQLVVQDFQGFSNGNTHGVALWTHNGQHYLAARQSQDFVDFGKIFDVTSCLTTGCSSLQNLEIWRSPQPLKPFPQSPEWLSASFSRSDSTPFIYFGNQDPCRDGEADFQTEYLLDVSNPAAPRDVTPQNHITDMGRQVDYWSWYYSDTVRGWAHFGPRDAKLNGQYLYRAAATIFDVHKWTGTVAGPPVASFTWSPETIYAGDPVTFTSTSTGGPTSFSWTFQDGGPASASSGSAQTAFTSPGGKTVSLAATNQHGTGNKSQNVTVLDPAPALSGITVTPAEPYVCQTVTLKADNVTGKAPLAFQWTANQVPVNGNASQVTWNTTSLGSGTYPVNVTVSRAGSPSATASTSVTLKPLVPLPAQGTFAPTKDAFSAGTVQFHVNAPGATEWLWDFGDGTPLAWTSDPVAGPNPAHSYTQAGSYMVKVSVRNCVEGQPAGISSSTLPVTVTQVAPLAVSTFMAQCPLFCDFTPGASITFTVAATGSPAQYEYDWNGNGFNGGDDQTSPTPVTTHVYTAQGSYRPKLRVRRGTEVSAPFEHGEVINVRGISPTVTVDGPGSGQTNTAYSFTATAANCTPTGWSWTAGAGAAITGGGAAVSITWSSAGTKTVVATATGCASGNKPVNISNPGGLTADFTFTPASPQADQTVTFNAGASTGSPAAYFWEFPDGASGSGVTVSRAFPAGSHSVKLTVYKDCVGGNCASSASVTKAVVVTGGPPQVVASFDTRATCTSDLTGVRCAAQTGEAVTFTSTSTGNPTSFTWSFNDGTPAGSGAQVSHTWGAPGTYLVQLTASNGQSSNSISRTFVVTDPPVSQKKSVVLPWIAQTRGALVQSSDLYVHNPGKTAMDVTLEFRKRGVPESNPPRVPRTIQPGATLYVGDVLRDLFNREGVAGFIAVTVDRGDVEPVITSFNTTFQADGKQFGQTVSGVSTSSAGSASGSGPESRMQHLVGLIDNTERLAYFGLSNPSDEPATYRLRFFDRDGLQISESQDLPLSRFGQRQYQKREIEELFGVSNVADYRIEIEKKAGGMIVPYASNLRLSSADPSFIEPGASKHAKSYLLGALSAPGLNNSTWQSDLLLTNVDTQAVTAQVTFTGVGLNSVPTTPVSVTLQPGQTERLENVIAGRWNIRNAAGVLTVSSTSPNGVFPIVQGESYESTNTDPAKRFGQSMTALSDADAAGPGKSQYLVGLRQDAKNRTTVWIFNPDTVAAEYEISYLGLDGKSIGPVSTVRLGAGKLRQLSPAQHPLPAAGVANGFTVQILVNSGKVLSAAQVINNVTNDPAYIQGEAR